MVLRSLYNHITRGYRNSQILFESLSIDQRSVLIKNTNRRGENSRQPPWMNSPVDRWGDSVGANTGERSAVGGIDTYRSDIKRRSEDFNLRLSLDDAHYIIIHYYCCASGIESLK